MSGPHQTEHALYRVMTDNDAKNDGGDVTQLYEILLFGDGIFYHDMAHQISLIAFTKDHSILF